MITTFPLLGESFSALKRTNQESGVQEILELTRYHLEPHPHLVMDVADVRRVRLKALADSNPALESSATARGYRSREPSCTPPQSTSIHLQGRW